MRHPTGPTAAADTAGNFARLSQRAANRPRFDINANGEFVNANIEVTQGSYLTFEVESTENGWCDTVYLGGVLSGTLFTGIGPWWCGKPEPVTIGPVATGGTYTIVTETSRYWAKIGFPGTARIRSMFNGGSYRVYIEDSDDNDFNDIVLIVTVRQPELALTCGTLTGQELKKPVSGQSIDVQITRGDTLSCEARSLNRERGPAWSRGWKFNGKAREDGDTESNVWRGVMVQSGVIEVKAHTGLRRDPSAGEETLKATVTVTNRDWSGRSPVIHAETVRNGTDPDPTTTLPARVEFTHHLGTTFFRADQQDYRRDYPEDPTAEVRGGPNNSLFYYKDLTFPAYAAIVLNDDAMARGSLFYLSQAEERNGNVINFGGTNYCPRTYVTGDLRADVLRHEEKHVEVFQTVRAFALADSIRAWETTVDSLGDAEMVDAYRREWRRTFLLGAAESKRVVDAKNGPYLVTFGTRAKPCTLYSTSGVDLKNEGDN
ncbi:MAG TPA: hypothetical protein VF710_00035 [Longimicrobium sp.]